MALSLIGGGHQKYPDKNNNVEGKNQKYKVKTHRPVAAFGFFP